VGYRGIHHLGFAVDDLDEAVATYERLFGAEVEDRATGEGLAGANVLVGGGRIELLAAEDADTPIGRFLASRGPGLHHVAYQVGDVDSVLAQLRERGLRLIDEAPRTGIRGSRVAFLHPAASGGVLTEIVQPAEGH